LELGVSRASRALGFRVSSLALARYRFGLGLGGRETGEDDGGELLRQRGVENARRSVSGPDEFLGPGATGLVLHTVIPSRWTF
jgi:hypothetical protein